MSTRAMSGAPENAKPRMSTGFPTRAFFGAVVMFDFTESSVTGFISSGLNVTPGAPGFSGQRYRSEERRVGKECRTRWAPDQAEDGIRDKLVTGVQTCALPIYVDTGDVGRAGEREATDVDRLSDTSFLRRGGDVRLHRELRHRLHLLRLERHPRRARLQRPAV